MPPVCVANSRSGSASSITSAVIGSGPSVDGSTSQLSPPSSLRAKLAGRCMSTMAA
jgi:hypothetical protein